MVTIGIARQNRSRSDVLRERVLRRCRLTFWRVRGSSFYRDPDSALEGLWEELRRLRIAPGGKDVPNENRHDSDTQGIEPRPEPDVDPPHQGGSESRSRGSESGPTEPSLPFPTEISSRQTTRDISSGELEPVIVAVLRGCPNQSCTKDSLTRRVLSHLHVVTRGAPRERLHRKVMRALAKLKDEGMVEEYTATNVRIRLAT